MINYFRLSLLVLLSTVISERALGQTLELLNCDEFLYTDHDRVDADSDGITCEFLIVAKQTAAYQGNTTCDNSDILWYVQVDVDNDGVVDYEYNSLLPTSDDQFDDTDGNGIVDMYTAPTSMGEVKELQLQDIAGPESSHKIIWEATDECNTMVICEQPFSILDTYPPTPLCADFTSFGFDGFDLEIFAEDFSFGVFDNCTELANIRYSFSPDSIVPSRFLTCDDVINSPVQQKMYVFDELDNVEFCVLFLNVIPNETVDCWPVSDIVDGYVTDPSGNPISDALVTIIMYLPEFPKSMLTDSLGYYAFDNVLNKFDFELTVEKEDDYLTDVTTLDLVLLLRHMLGLQPLGSSYLEFAGDVDSDGDLKSTDLVLMRKLILGVVSYFPNTTPWRFIDSSYDFDDPTGLPGYPDNHRENIIGGPQTVGPYNFVGVKMGNVRY